MKKSKSKKVATKKKGNQKSQAEKNDLLLNQHNEPGNKNQKNHNINFQGKVWLNTKETAIYIGTTVGSIRNMVYRRQINSYKPNGNLLFRKSEIDRWIELSRLE